MHEYKQKANSNHQSKWKNNRTFPKDIQIFAQNTADMRNFILFFFYFYFYLLQSSIYKPLLPFWLQKKYRAIKPNNFRYNFLDTNWGQLTFLFFDFWDSKTANIIRSKNPFGSPTFPTHIFTLSSGQKVNW